MNHLNEPIALGQAGGHRLIGDYVQPGIGRAHSKITMPLGLRTDRRHIEIILSNRLGQIAHIRDAKLVGKLLIALVHPIRLVGIIGHHNQLEPWMRRHGTR